MAILHVRLLGDFQLLYGNQVVAGLNQTRQQSLLAYLLLHRAAPQSRQHLAFQFWPDSSETQARANLRQMLHHLHHTLPTADQCLQIEAKTVQWLATAPFTLDVGAFEHQLWQATAAEQSQQYVMLRAALAAAVELYHGDLLPACDDDWILPDREQWRGKFLLLFFAELLYRHMGQANLVFAVLEKITALATQYAIWMLKLESRSTQGWLLVQQGDFARGIAQMRTEIDELKQNGHTMFQTHRMGLLDEAFAMSDQSGQRSWDAELYRLKGELLCALGEPGIKAELAYAQALQVARQQSAKSLELRAATSLSQLWQRQGKRVEAYNLLLGIYGWFTEGFDTVDLQAAKALLAELA